MITNKKEKRKKIWQFIFLMAGMAIIPVALIFLAYYKVPHSIAADELKKLGPYSEFLRKQKKIVEKMTQIDSNIKVYADARMENPGIQSQKILNGINDLEQMDTSIAMVQVAKVNLENHYTHVLKLIDLQTRILKAEEEIRALRQNISTMGAGGMGGVPTVPFPTGQ